MTTPLLEIEDLRATTVEGDIEILRGIDLTVYEGDVHALLGRAGSGSSALARVLLGSPEYIVTGGTIRFRGEDISAWGPDLRGQAGIFLALPSPEDIPGVSAVNLLRQALSARTGIDRSVLELQLSITEWMERLGKDPSSGERSLDEASPGANKQRREILQMALLEPELAILDETAPGLDIDSLGVIARGVQAVRTDRPHMGVLAITHDQRLVDELEPDHVHIIVDGRVVESGGMELAEALERSGYERFEVAA